MTSAAETKNYLKGFYKVLFTLALPIILQNLMQTFVNMLDTVMVGRLGSQEIAAVGLGNQVYFMLNMVSFGISSGCAIFISQYWGQLNIKGIRKTTGLMVLFCTVFSVLFMTAAVLKPEFLLGLYSKDPAVIEKGIPYLRLVAFSYPFTAISFAYQMSFRSTEHVYLPMVCTGISLVLNVILNGLFIFGLGMGVKGAALATLICRIIEFLTAVIWSYSHKYEACGSIKEMLSYDREFVSKVIVTALPVLLSETIWGLGITFQNGIFARAGTDAIAAFQITNTINQLTWIFFIGMGNASAIILGKKIGAGEIEPAKAYAFRFCWFMPLSGAVIGLLLIPLSFTLKYLFKVEPEIIDIACTMLFVLVAVYPMRAFNMYLIIGICRAGGDTLFSMFIDNFFMWTASIPLGFAAAFWWKLAPWQIMAVLEAEQLIKMILGGWRIKSGKWLHILTV